MTAETDIVFYCTFCGQKIITYQDASGVRVACPTCNHRIHVPDSHPSTITGSACIKSETVLMEAEPVADDEALPAVELPRRRSVFRILALMRHGRPRSAPAPTSIAGPASMNSDTALMEAEEVIEAPLSPVPQEPDRKRNKLYLPSDMAQRLPVRPAKAQSAHDKVMIAAGFICLVVGVAGALHEPQHFLKLTAFFAVAAIVGLFCLAEKHALWGIGLLLSSSVLFLSLMPPNFQGTMQTEKPAPRESQPSISVAPLPLDEPTEGPSSAPAAAIRQPQPITQLIPAANAQPAPTRSPAPLWFTSAGAPEEESAPAETIQDEIPEPSPTQIALAPAATPAPAAALAEAYAQVNLADGINADEAVTIADAYFDVYISGCGMASGATDKGNAWEVATFIDYNMRSYTPISVDKKTGRVRCTGYPTVESGVHR